jgi:transcriptional regulator with XRE-family HTH domain
MGETRLQREARLREVDIRRAIGRGLRELRIDTGLSIAEVARAAGIDRGYLSRIETGVRAASIRVLTAIATVLGADLSMKLYPTTGPRIRDRLSAPMGEVLVRALHSRWVADPEVLVQRPARGVIDYVLSDRLRATVVASEIQSEIRRLEQQVRWHRQKEESLPSADLWRLLAGDQEMSTSRLLILRSTRTTRELANTFEATLRAAYPARASDIVRALTTADAPWPGAGIVWMRVEGPHAELLAAPPRGVTLGR